METRFSCNVLSRIRDDLLGRQSMSQKEMCVEIAKPRKTQKLRKRPVAHRLDFTEGRGKKRQRIQRFPQPSKTGCFQLSSTICLRKTATVPSNDALFSDISTIRTFASGKFLLRLASAPRLAQRVSPHAAGWRAPHRLHPKTHKQKSKPTPTQHPERATPQKKETFKIFIQNLSQKKPINPEPRTVVIKENGEQLTVVQRESGAATVEHRSTAALEDTMQGANVAAIASSAEAREASKGWTRTTRTSTREKAVGKKEEERRPRESEGKRRGRRQPSTPSWLSLTS